MKQLIGRVLDRKYRLTALIGEGGMGTVYEAEHVLLRRKVAVKIMHPEFVSRPDSVERFFREAKAASAIGHPNIIDIQDVGREDDDTIFIVMELLTGRSLDSLIDELGKCTPEHAVTVVVQILSALKSAHEKGIIHRDLKAENVFLSLDKRGREEIKLLDFGIAKIEQGNTANLGLTKEGNVVGTPFYLSPEQAKGGKKADHRVDIWGAGVLLYEMLTGALPFNGENYNEILSAILLETPRPISDYAPDVPQELCRVVERAMSKDPEERFVDVSEMIEALLPLQKDGREEMSTIVFETLHRSQLDLLRKSSPPSSPSGDRFRDSDPAAMTADLDTTGLQYTDSIHDVAGRKSSLVFFIAGGAGLAVIAAIAAVVLIGFTGEEAPPPLIRTTEPSHITVQNQEPSVETDEAKVEEPQPEIELVKIHLTGVPEGATLTLDGEDVGEPIERPKSDQKRTLVVEAPGYEPFETTLIFSEDGAVEIDPTPVVEKKSPKKRRPGKKKAKKPKGSGWEDNPFG